ncbi:aromatic ring-hydroxylating oxygenase subunit alpha [Lyngbya confervoides]|uniref:Aromatic ring-hydroxylating dioxygenase subunit alpha n=1 Tax=Lyngbya confervoides BDU141951 TaxID=1574623 RepID=A0ABD4T1X8_9CYAN|nr:aromatic ring-hydroxylating dioxygenase subunit alpha [Lyngbya confervoides]MCM1982438.1 aromatic ring-hydroxylating dioxygenase subunit alpha [Lyngbya confervoides BDU141951]
MSLPAIQRQIIETADRPLERAIALPAAAYTDPDFYAWEVDHWLKQQWLCVGHVAQIPQVGDYRNLELLGERLVILRDEADSVRVLSRVCVHRGMDVMPPEFAHASQGNCRTLVCPYHHWSYRLDGGLKAAPEMHRHSDFALQNLGLPQVRTEVWEGFIFITFDLDLDPVETQYADLKPFLGPQAMAELDLVVSLDWDCPFNWKVLVENFMESYHHLGAHHRTFEPLMPAARTWTEVQLRNVIVGHLPIADRVLADAAAREALFPFSLSPHLAPPDLREYRVCLGVPTFLLFIGPDRVYWYQVQPQGPDRMKLTTTMLVRPESKALDHYDSAIQSAIAGLQEFHREDLEMCSAVQAGLNSSFYRPGPLSHLEMPVWQFQQYLAAQIRTFSF